MRHPLNIRYRQTAEKFARRVAAALGRQVHALVLYGSVAREQARRDSDIDVLVAGASRQVGEHVFEIGYELMERVRFEDYIGIVYYTRQEFEDLVRLGSPFISNVLDQGITLYDDGTLASIRHGVHTRG